MTGETKVFTLFDRLTGQEMGVYPTRYQAAKAAAELGGRKYITIRAEWVRAIVTNSPESFSQCQTR